ncbi:MAG TPA: hypothetical protein VLI72_00510 [Methylibium sp.]|nr:hypothetical protein [Methylibium sp.]
MAALLVLALLWAQAIGLAHRAVHALGVPHVAVATVADALGHAPQSPECRLFDQLAAGDMLVAAPALVAAAPAAAAASLPLPTCHAGRVCLAYAARAPPFIA